MQDTKKEILAGKFWKGWVSSGSHSLWRLITATVLLPHRGTGAGRHVTEKRGSTEKKCGMCLISHYGTQKASLWWHFMQKQTNWSCHTVNASWDLRSSSFCHIISWQFQMRKYTRFRLLRYAYYAMNFMTTLNWGAITRRLRFCLSQFCINPVSILCHFSLDSVSAI